MDDDYLSDDYEDGFDVDSYDEASSDEAVGESGRQFEAPFEVLGSDQLTYMMGQEIDRIVGTFEVNNFQSCCSVLICIFDTFPFSFDDID